MNESIKVKLFDTFKY